MLWLRYLIAFVVACHGFIYIPFGILVPGKLKQWKGTSRLLGGAIVGDRLKALVAILHITSGIVIIACAVAIAFVPSAIGWWRSFAIIGSILGIASFAAFWDGQIQLLAEEGAIGMMMNLFLLAGAIAFARIFG